MYLIYYTNNYIYNLITITLLLRSASHELDLAQRVILMGHASIKSYDMELDRNYVKY